MLGLSSQPMNTPLVQQGLQAAEQAITLAPDVPLYWRNAAVLLSLAGDQSASRQPQILATFAWHVKDMVKDMFLLLPKRLWVICMFRYQVILQGM